MTETIAKSTRTFWIPEAERSQQGHRQQNGTSNNDSVFSVSKVHHRGENDGVKPQKKSKDRVVIYVAVCSPFCEYAMNAVHLN